MTCKWNTKDDAWSNLNCTQIVSPSNHTHQENNKKSKEPAKKLHQQQTKWISQMQHVIVWEVHSMQGACNSVYAACAQHVNSCGNRFRPRNFCPHKADLEVALSTRIFSEILRLRRGFRPSGEIRVAGAGFRTKSALTTQLLYKIRGPLSHV